MTHGQQKSPPRLSGHPRLFRVEIWQEELSEPGNLYPYRQVLSGNMVEIGQILVSAQVPKDHLSPTC